MLDDEEVGKAQLEDVFNQNIVDAFTGASGKSEA